MQVRPHLAKDNSPYLMDTIGSPCNSEIAVLDGVSLRRHATQKQRLELPTHVENAIQYFKTASLQRCLPSSYVSHPRPPMQVPASHQPPEGGRL